MKLNFKPSVSSRATVRSLIVACLPTAAVGLVAGSPAVGAVFSEGANHGFTVDDNAVSTNAPATNGAGTNIPSATNPPPPMGTGIGGMRG